CSLQKTLVDVTDLFDIEAVVGKLSTLKRLHGVEQQQNRTIVDRQRGRVIGFPVRTLGASLEEREPGGIEERAPERGQAHGIVPDTAVDRAEDGKEPPPRIPAALQDFFGFSA